MVISRIILSFLGKPWARNGNKRDRVYRSFKEIPDYRIDRRKLHSVEEIFLVTFCGMIAGCDSWNDLELFGKTKLAYLQKYFP